MPFPLQIALLLNIGLLMPVMLGIERNAAWAREHWGKRSPSRDLLLAVYGGVFLLSAGALLLQDVQLAQSLLLLQVLSQAGGLFTAKERKNLAVLIGFALALFHGGVLAWMLVSPAQ